MNIFIKKPTQKEIYGSKPKQDKMRQLQKEYENDVFYKGFKVVYMPYGEHGKGFYLTDNEE